MLPAHEPGRAVPRDARVGDGACGKHAPLRLGAERCQSAFHAISHRTPPHCMRTRPSTTVGSPLAPARGSLCLSDFLHASACTVAAPTELRPSRCRSLPTAPSPSANGRESSADGFHAHLSLLLFCARWSAVAVGLSVWLRTCTGLRVFPALRSVYSPSVPRERMDAE